MSNPSIASEVAWLLEERRKTGEFPRLPAYTRKFGKKSSAYYDRIQRCETALAASNTAVDTALIVTTMQGMLARFEEATATMMGALADAQREGKATVGDAEKAITGLSRVWDRTVSDSDKKEARGRPTLLEEALKKTQYGDGE